MAIKICEHCGYTMKEDWLYCKNCGERVKNEKPKSELYNKDYKSKLFQKWLVGFIVNIFIGAYFFFKDCAVYVTGELDNVKHDLLEHLKVNLYMYTLDNIHDIILRGLIIPFTLLILLPLFREELLEIKFIKIINCKFNFILSFLPFKSCK